MSIMKSSSLFLNGDAMILLPVRGTVVVYNHGSLQHYSFSRVDSQIELNYIPVQQQELEAIIDSEHEPAVALNIGTSLEEAFEAMETVYSPAEDDGVNYDSEEEDEQEFLELLELMEFDDKADKNIFDGTPDWLRME